MRTGSLPAVALRQIGEARMSVRRSVFASVAGESPEESPAYDNFHGIGRLVSGRLETADAHSRLRVGSKLSIWAARDRGHPPSMNCHYGALSSFAKGREIGCQQALISHATRPKGGSP
jgi:hypothetical protein